MNIRTVVVSAALAGLAATLPATGSADPVSRATLHTNASGESYWAIPVHYNDLNLAVPAGQQALAERLRAAARKVCHRDYLRQDTIDTKCATRAYQKAESKMLAVIATSNTTQLTQNDR